MCYCFNNAETVETKINFVMSLVTVHIQSNVVMSKLSKYKLML
jgi:cytochrome b